VAKSGDLLLDYSRNLLDGTSRKLLLQLARETRIGAAIEAMFSGAHLNTTEDRPALHVAL
jgi:glucose-6-phosphate isomerase